MVVGKMLGFTKFKIQKNVILFKIMTVCSRWINIFVIQCDSIDNNILTCMLITL